MANLEILTQPFDNVRTREGAGGKQFSYVAGGDILDRILSATDGHYDWEILNIRLIDGQTRANKKTGEVYTAPSVWMVHGRLSLPGMGRRDGVGTATAESEESPKSAETDALKRAAVKFGVALHLYRKDEQETVSPAARRQSAGGAGTINATKQQCPSCHAPAGKPHVKGCRA